MTGPGRGRIVAAQAVVVVAVSLVVYLVLLRPESGDQPAGIEVPGNGRIVPEREGERRAGAGGPGERRSTRPPAAAASAPAAVPATGAPGPQAPGSPFDPPVAALGEGPAADQYADSLARISARLR